MDNATYTKLLEEERAKAKASLGDSPVYDTGSANELSRQSLLDQINNRKEFSYNFNDDALYNMYKDKYTQQGRMAMKDTMGQAAALTGGYGSSYGQAVGQQAYDRQLQSLNDVIPQLYGQAFNVYQEEGNQLQNRYGMANDLVAEDWNRYRANVSDWNYQNEQAEARAQAAAQAAYQQDQDAWNRQQQAYANLASLISASGYTPTSKELAAAGMTAAAAAALRNEYLRQIKPAAGGGAGGGYYSGGSSKKKTDDGDKDKNGNTVSVSDMLAPAGMEEQYRIYSDLSKSSGISTSEIAKMAEIAAKRYGG